MGSSGLIYAAIVAVWAAVLVPRWIRRNEEIDRAREEDAARGVRVLDRHQRHPRAPHVSATGELAAGQPNRPARESRSVDQPVDAAPSQESGSSLAGSVRAGPAVGTGTTRRRRVLTVLLLTLVTATLGTIAGLLPAGLIGVPAAVLLGFVVLARRATVREASWRHRGRMRQLARHRAEAAARHEHSHRRVAVLDEPEPVEPTDPDAWEPISVPLPTYLTKPKAEPHVVRTIDLTSAGAWTSGRLNPASSVAMPPPHSAADAEFAEHRPAVGD